MGLRGYIALSERVSVSAGGTYQLPLKLKKGAKGPRGLEHLHVTKLFLKFTGVDVAALPNNCAVDPSFLAQLVSSISVFAGADSPFGVRKGGQLVKDMSLYLALTALSRMTDAPMLQFGAQAIAQYADALSATDAAPNVFNSATYAALRSKRIKGKFHTQGPFGSFLAGTPITQQDVTFTLPLGERCGEANGMNPIPLSYLNGGGSECGCSKAEGTVNITLATAIGPNLAVTFSQVQVFAEVIALPSVHVPLQPWVNQYQTTDTVITLDPGISGFRALCEDLDATGNMQLPNMVGVTQRKLTLDGYEPYESQYPEARAAWVAGNATNGDAHEVNAEADPSAVADVYAGTLAAVRYNNPWVPIITHQGPTGSAPDFGQGCARRVTFELVNASAAVNRRIVQGLWLTQDDAYFKRGAEAAGVPVDALQAKTALGAVSPAAQARGILAGIPVVAPKTVAMIPG